MIISIRFVRHTKKDVDCCECGEKIHGSCFKSYGAAEVGEKPYNLYAHPTCIVQYTGQTEFAQAFEKWATDYFVRNDMQIHKVRHKRKPRKRAYVRNMVCSECHKDIIDIGYAALRKWRRACEPGKPKPPIYCGVKCANRASHKKVLASIPEAPTHRNCGLASCRKRFRLSSVQRSRWRYWDQRRFFCCRQCASTYGNIDKKYVQRRGVAKVL